MSYTYTGVSEADRAGKGNVGRPDTPNLTTGQMQEVLDELSNLAIDKLNDLVTQLNGHAGLAIESTQITNMRIQDNELQFSFDNGETWGNTGSVIQVDASPNDIHMDDYAIAEAVAAILTTDTLNQAVGKLEKKSNVNADNLTDATVVNDFPITTTWETNEDVGDYSTYPYKQVISTNKFTNASETGYCAPNHEIMASTPDSWLTEAQKEDIYKINDQIDISTSGITLIAKEATTNALTLRVYGLGIVKGA